MMKKYFLMLLLVSIFLISGCGSEKKVTLKEIGIQLDRNEIEQMIKKYKLDFENKDQDVKLMFVKKLSLKKRRCII